MNTINKAFNECWKYLAEFHPTAHLPNGDSLDLTTKPKVSQKEWEDYLLSLITVLKVGFGNNWLDIHPDEKGRLVFFFVPEDIGGEIKIKEERIRG